MIFMGASRRQNVDVTEDALKAVIDMKFDHRLTSNKTVASLAIMFVANLPVEVRKQIFSPNVDQNERMRSLVGASLPDVLRNMPTADRPKKKAAR